MARGNKLCMARREALPLSCMHCATKIMMTELFAATESPELGLRGARAGMELLYGLERTGTNP